MEKLKIRFMLIVLGFITIELRGKGAISGHANDLMTELGDRLEEE